MAPERVHVLKKGLKDNLLRRASTIGYRTHTKTIHFFYAASGDRIKQTYQDFLEKKSMRK